MITYIEGNLFLSTAQTLVNTVNTVGVMGKGIARDFKHLYPAMFEEYKRHCDEGTLAMGSLLLYRTAHKWVVNFPTKRHWKQASRLSDIELGLETFQRTYAEQGITSIAFPQLGCGHGGLDWESQVRPLMERYLGALPIEVFIHIPPDSPLTSSCDTGADRKLAHGVTDANAICRVPRRRVVASRGKWNWRTGGVGSFDWDRSRATDCLADAGR